MALRCFFKNLPILCTILIKPLFYQGFYTKDGLDFLLTHGRRSVRPTCLGPSGLVFCFYPLQLSWRDKVLADNGMSGGENSEATSSVLRRQNHEESLMEPVNDGIQIPAVTTSSSKQIDDSCVMESP